MSSLRALLAGPSYWQRPMGLRHLDLRVWQATAMFETTFVLGAVLALAEVVPAATPLAVPLTLLGIVKAHDGLAGLLGRPARG